MAENKVPFPFSFDDKGRWHDEKGRYVKGDVVESLLESFEPVEEELIYRVSLHLRIPVHGVWRDFLGTYFFEGEPDYNDLLRTKKRFVDNVGLEIGSYQYAWENVDFVEQGIQIEPLAAMAEGDTFVEEEPVPSE